MSKIDKTLLRKQIEVFLSHSKRDGRYSYSYDEWLEYFCRRSPKEDVLDICDSDVDLFLEWVDNVEPTQFQRLNARKAIYSFRRYYMARTKNGRARLRAGRPPLVDQHNRVGELKEKNGLSFRQIGVLLNPKKPVDVGLVYRWYRRYLSYKR
jgi:hypothetical protein